MLLRVVAVVAWLVASAAHVHADTVALLPLDGEKRLEIYGQPVASEMGRALKAHGLDVVVVGAKMAVPDKAQLIVDGTITADKKNAITLSIRIRDPRNGTVLETLPATATTLTTIDKAAADLSLRIVPAVKAHLEALAKPPVQPAQPVQPVQPDRPIDARVQPPSAPRLAGVLVAVASPRSAQPALALLTHGLADELPRWSAQHKREARKVGAEELSRARGAQTVSAAQVDLGIALEVLRFSVEPGEVPMARARVRVRVVHAGTIIFERVVRTDTIVGDKGITEQDMAVRVGREVLAIVNAQLRRKVPGWR